ncbi:MAG: cyclic pyranopterin monophosphate synthase MoaC [Candidatus Aminicenantales bacterium]
MAKLSHVDREGKARMVDVGAKAVTRREAAASAFVKLSPETIGLIRANGLAKGDVLNTSRLAGIQAAKRAHELIPLTHPIPLENVTVDLDVKKTGVRVRCRVTAEAKTGAEMEALTGAAIAALTIYDMVKAVERGAEVVRLRLDYKSGGKSGVYRRKA